jgi:hypothetical protein
VDYVVERVEGAVNRLRAISPSYEAARGGARLATQ